MGRRDAVRGNRRSVAFGWRRQAGGRSACGNCASVFLAERVAAEHHANAMLASARLERTGRKTARDGRARVAAGRSAAGRWAAYGTAGAVGRTSPGTGRIVGPVARFRRLVHHVVAARRRRGTGAVGLAAAGAGGIIRSVTGFVRLVHHVVATDGQRGAGTVRPAAAGAGAVRRPVAVLARLVHHVVATDRRGGAGAVRPAATGAGAVRRPVALLARLVHHVVAADRQRRAGAVRPAAAGAGAVGRPVALLARLVHHVVATDRRRSARAVHSAAPGARTVRRPVALLARLVRPAVAAEGDDGRQDREQHLRFADGCFLRVVLDVVQRRSIERKAVDTVAADGRGQIEVHSLAQQDGSCLTEQRTVDRRLGLPRHRELVPATTRDGVQSAARIAARARAFAHDEPQARGGDVAVSDAVDAHAEERAVEGARIDLEHWALAVVGGCRGCAYRGVGLDHRHRRSARAVGSAEARA